MLSTRDSESYAWAMRQKALANHPELLLSADPVLAGRLSYDSQSEPVATLDEYVLIIPKPTGDLPTPRDETTEVQALALMIQHINETTGLRSIILPMNPHQDMIFCEKLNSATKDDVTLFDMQEHQFPASALWSVISSAQLVLSYRLHGLVSAVASGVPAMGVAYDPKVRAFADEIGFPYCYPATVHEDAALSDLARLWHSREEVVAGITAKRNEMLVRLHTCEERFHELW
jgi:polysaccharide pyruvyl transferase WcaK-like protein